MWQVMEGLIDHLMTCSRLNQTKLQSFKVRSHYSAQFLTDSVGCYDLPCSDSWPVQLSSKPHCQPAAE